jgi:hypothetical protein
MAASGELNLVRQFLVIVQRKGDERSWSGHWRTTRQQFRIGVR